jgi:ABC-type sugar transport system permease subunit
LTHTIFQDDDQESSNEAFNYNDFQMKKTFAQSLMDVALFSSNAKLLHDLVEDWKRETHDTDFFVCITLTAISLVLQVVLGLGFAIHATHNLEKAHHIRKANRMNNWICICTVIITIVNILIPIFQP